MRFALLLSALACAVHNAVAMYERSDVVVLDEAALAKLMKSDGVAAVEFYAPWCGHCKSLAPHWEKAATNLKGIATLGAVDCDNKANQGICGRFGIQGFPTIKLFGPDQQKNPYTGEVSKEAEDYKGPRTAKAIVDGVMGLLSDVHVEKPRNAEQLKQFTTAKPESHKVVLLSEKKEVSGLYKSLSTQLHRHMAFAQVQSESVPEAAELLGMTGDVTLPAVAVFKAGGGVEPYVGPVKALALLTWLRQFAPAGAEPEAEATGAKGSKTKGQAQAKLLPMTVGQLPELDQNEDMQLVALHVAASPEACETKAASFQSAAAELQGILGLVAVNLTPDELTQVSRFGLDVAATKTEVEAEGCALRIVLLPFGSDKDDLEDWQVYPSGPVEGKALYKWTLSHVPAGMFTMEVTPAIMPEFVHMTGRPIKRTHVSDDDDEDDEEASGNVPVPPKLVLFTNKDEVPDLFKAVAMAFRNRMPGLGFGWVRAHTAEGQEVVKSTRAPKVPGVVLLVHVPKDVPTPESGSARPSQTATAMSSQPYTGPNTFKAISMWLEQMIKLVETMYGVDSAAPGPSVQQVSSAQDLDTHCVSRGSGICVIGLLGTSDPKSAKPWTQLLSKVAAKHKDQPIYFSWMDAAKYSQFATDCGAMSSDIPTLVALSAKRMRVAAFPGRLTQGAEGITAASSFIDSVLSGRTRTNILEALPRVQAAGSDSSGSSGTAATKEAEVPVEEEFDLSDIMSEEVEGSEVGLSKEERLKQADAEIQAAAEAARQREEQEKSQKSKKSKKSKKKKKAKATNEEL